MSPSLIAAKLRRHARAPGCDGALLRRAAALIDGGSPCVTVDLVRNRAVLAGHARVLSAGEAEFLHALAAHDGYATFDTLADACWGVRRSGVGDARAALRQLAHRVNLRIAGTPCRIAPVRGRGYAFADAERH